MIETTETPQARLSKPMDLGAILDGAFSLYRRHFAVLVGSVGILLVPLALISIAFGPWGLFLTYFAGLLTPAIGALVAGDVAVGRQPTIGGIWSRMARLVLPLLLTSVLVWLAVGVGFILVIIPGILFYVWFSLFAQAIAIEDRRYFRAMGRSRQLVRGSWWRVFGILLVISIVTGIAQQLVQSIVTALLGVVGVGSGPDLFNTGGGAQGFSHLTTVPVVLGSTIATLLVAPIAALAPALLYFDLRLRKEGTDIAAAVDALG
jgi:hypothetical protein